MEGIYAGYAEVLLTISLEIFRLDPQKSQDTTEQSRKIAVLATKAEESHSGRLKKKIYIYQGKHTHTQNNNS